MAVVPADYLPTSATEIEFRWFDSAGVPLWGGCDEARSTFVYRGSTFGQVDWDRGYVRYQSPYPPGGTFGHNVELVSPIDNVLRSPLEPVILRFTSIVDNFEFHEITGSSRWGTLSVTVRGDTIIVDHSADAEFCQNYILSLEGIAWSEGNPDLCHRAGDAHDSISPPNEIQFWLRQSQGGIYHVSGPPPGNPGDLGWENGGSGEAVEDDLAPLDKGRRP
jgi:hypothetical protein